MNKIEMHLIPKIDLLAGLFKNVGDELKIKDVLDETGIGSKGALKTWMWVLKDKNKVPSTQIMDLILIDGKVRRVK